MSFYPDKQLFFCMFCMIAMHDAWFVYSRNLILCNLSNPILQTDLTFQPMIIH